MTLNYTLLVWETRLFGDTWGLSGSVSGRSGCLVVTLGLQMPLCVNMKMILFIKIKIYFRIGLSFKKKKTL